MTLYRCTIKGVFASGRTWSVRQHFSSSATLATVESDWSAAVVDLYTNGTHGIQTLYPTTTIAELTQTYQLAVTPVTTSTGVVDKVLAVAVAQDTHSLAGTSANDGLPDQDAVLVSLRTAGVGPNHRGRTRLPACDETIVTGDIMGNTEATRVSAAMTALRAAMASAGHTQVLFNDKVSARDPIVATTKPVTLSETDKVIRTVRPRVRKEAAQYV